MQAQVRTDRPKETAAPQVVVDLEAPTGTDPAAATATEAVEYSTIPTGAESDQTLI